MHPDLFRRSHGVEHAADDLRRAGAAGFVGRFCFHQLGVGQDDAELIVQSMEELAKLRRLIHGTPIEQILNRKRESIHCTPWPHAAIRLDRRWTTHRVSVLNLRLHQPASLVSSALVFTAPDMQQRLARLRALQLPTAARLPFALSNSCNALLLAPEGTQLLLLESDY